MIFLDFLMCQQTFLSPEVKRFAIITYKQGIYELPHELRSTLSLRKIRKYQQSVLNPDNDSPVPSLTTKMKILLILVKNY